MTSLSEVARETRRRFCADLEARGFATGSVPESYAGTISTPVGNRRIEIRLDAGFPYHKPSVIPLDTDYQRVGEHQGPLDFGLCLWPDEGPGWTPETGAIAVLERAAKWFEHDANGSWPQSDYAPDAHLLYRGTHPLMVYESDWPPPSGVDTWGHFVVWQPTLESRAVIAGRPRARDAAVDRTGASPLAHAFATGAMTAESGIWMRVKAMPAPSDNLAGVIAAVDAVRDADTPKLAALVRRGLGGRAHERYLGIIYPGPSGEEHSLFIHASVRSGVRPEGFGTVPISALQSAPATPGAMRRRLPPNHAGLVKEFVLVFGCGALGSSIALTLAKSGVGQLGLVDSDTLRPGHLIRHAASGFFVGAPKVQALEATIKSSAPGTVVQTLIENKWDFADLCTYVELADLVVDATATESFTALLGEVCQAVGRPLLWTYVQRSGQVGFCRLYRPGADPCPQCCLTGIKGAIDPDVPRDENPEFHESGCGVPSSVAAAADIEATANAATRLAIDCLMGAPAANQRIVVTTPIPAADAPLTLAGVHDHSNPISNTCPVCRS